MLCLTASKYQLAAEEAYPPLPYLAELPMPHVVSSLCRSLGCCVRAQLQLLCRFVKDRDGKGGKVVKLTGSLDAKNR